MVKGGETDQINASYLILSNSLTVSLSESHGGVRFDLQLRPTDQSCYQY